MTDLHKSTEFCLFEVQAKHVPMRNMLSVVKEKEKSRLIRDFSDTKNAGVV